MYAALFDRQTPVAACHLALAQTWTNEAAAYATDAWQRGVMTLDVLRERGNQFISHAIAGKPAMLKFEHELLMDGRSLPQPCNYSLLRILPPAGLASDDTRRPIVIVDPRAGHGPGIGGFKTDSEVGVALRAGHAVYFITFAPEPVEGQTLADVARAEAAFVEEVSRRHPHCPAKPAVIGNCQAGWAVATLASLRPDIMGPLVLNGAPLSYWAGSPEQNPMRYAGGMLGGAWLSALTSDLSGDRFDGAWLVQNFENLNLGNTYWGKYYQLYANIDTEGERFLEFERWWGGYFRMTGEEIESIVENLFIGNRLTRGEMVAQGQPLDLRHVSSPIVIFASWGDNITPPQQALNWIIDVWDDEKALIAAGRTIVYMLHPTVGHLGIFVGGAVAQKEHDQMVNTLDQIEALPPGLFEMKILPKQADTPFSELEPGKFSVRFETRTVADILALNPNGRRDEAVFSTVAQVSEFNLQAYRRWAQPWVKLVGNPLLGDLLRWAHPLRQQHLALSDLSPLAAWVRPAAALARQQRQPVAASNPWLAWERLGSQWITDGLNHWGRLRDEASVNWVTQAYGSQGLGALLPPQVAERLAAHPHLDDASEQARRLALAHAGEGGFAEAVCRLVLLGIARSGVLERRSLRLAEVLARSHGQLAQQAALLAGGEQPLPPMAPPQWQTLLDGQALIVAFAQEAAIQALPRLLPTPEAREHAMALAAAVLMVQPALADPASPLAREAHKLLGVDPARVAALTLPLAQSVLAEQQAGRPGAVSARPS